MIAAAILLARLEDTGLTLRATDDGRLGVNGTRTSDTDSEIRASKPALLAVLRDRSRRGVPLVGAWQAADVVRISEYVRATTSPIGVASDATNKTLFLAFERFVVECKLPDVRTCTEAELDLLDALGEAMLLVHNAQHVLTPLAREFSARFSRVIDTYIACCVLEHALIDRREPFTMDDLAFRELRFIAPSVPPYVAIYVHQLHRLWEHLAAKLLDAGLRDVAQIEFNAIATTIDMQVVGMRVDADAVQRLAESGRKAATIQREAIENELGCPLFSDHARAALARVGLPIASISAESVASYADVTIARQILRSLAADSAAGAVASNIGLNTFVPMGRIRARVRQLATAAGKFSTFWPNVHQLALTPTTRTCIVADHGRALVSASYSDARLRILADHIRDIELMAVFAANGCPHVRTASLILRKFDSEVIGEERALGQLVNEFAFGVTPEKFIVDAYASGAELTRTKANELRTVYLALNPTINEWLTEAILGRRLDVAGSMHRVDSYVQATTDAHSRIVAPFDATIMNATKWALADLSVALSAWSASVVFCGVGELLVDTPSEHADEVRTQIELALTSTLRDLVATVPITVVTAVGAYWIDPSAASVATT